MDTNNNYQKNVKYYDGTNVAIQFINYFYQSWINNIDNLINENIIMPFSKLSYNNNIYEGYSFAQLLKSLSNNINFTNCKYNILDSRSRQIYILVVGNIISNSNIKNFSQSFMLSYSGEKKIHKWILMNSLLIIN